MDILHFTTEHCAFGRHQTFPLRFGWLTKGFRAVDRDRRVFDREEAIVTLGVGKNMVSAIKYWLQAARMIEVKSLNPTPLGKKIFSEDGFDPYLEDEATIWLIHWLIASNPMQATSIYWFFSNFSKSEFEQTTVFSALKNFVQDKGIHIAENTLKQDITVLLRMYSPSLKESSEPLEESLDSPLALLSLINHSDKKHNYRTQFDEHHGLPFEVVGFALSELFEVIQQKAIPIENLLYHRSDLPTLATVFRLTENALLAQLEQLIQAFPKHYQLRESAGLHQIYQVKPLVPLTLIESYYRRAI